MRKVTVLCAIALAIAMTGVAYYFWSQPTRLTIAVGPPESDDTRLVQAIAHRLQARHDPIQIKLLYTDGSVQASEAIDGGKSDLAVTRGDLPKQPNAGLMLTLHKDAVMLLATRSSRIKKITDLKGKRVGVVRLRTGSEVRSINTDLLKSVLSYYSLTEQDVKIIPALIDDVGRMAGKDFDSLFVVAPSGESVAARAVEAMGQGTAAGPVFVPISEPDALVYKYPNLVKDQIVRGTYGGEPAKPSANVDTIAVPHSIVASNVLADNTVADLTRSIFRLKTVLTRDNRLAIRIEAPPTDKDAASPLHPGAAAYLDDEEQTFFDKYGDIFYIGSMILGVFASAIAALFSRQSSDHRHAALEALEHALALLSRARGVATLGEIEALEQEADQLLADVVRNAVKAHLNTSDIASFNITLQQIRDVLQTRRIAIADGSRSLQPIAIGDLQERLARASSEGRLTPKIGPAAGSA